MVWAINYGFGKSRLPGQIELRRLLFRGRVVLQYINVGQWTLAKVLQHGPPAEALRARLGRGAGRRGAGRIKDGSTLIALAGAASVSRPVRALPGGKRNWRGCRMWKRLYKKLEIVVPEGYRPVAKPSRRDLDAFEKQFGFKLPRSYREFMEVFGPGTLADYFRIDDPANSKGSLRKEGGRK